MRGVFVTGTDTGVGKTVITAAIVLALRARGIDAGVAKPFQTGAQASDPDGDAMLLKRWTGVTDAAHEIAPYCFADPLAPLAAAELEGRSVMLAEAVERLRALAARHAALVVEGVGGLLVPVGEDWTVADLAAALALPVLVVARDGLGTINHTALTVLAARAHGLEPAGVVLNGAGDHSSPSNARLIERLTGVPVLGRTPRLDGPLTPERLRALVEEHLDLAAIVSVAVPSLEVSRA